MHCITYVKCTLSLQPPGFCSPLVCYFPSHSEKFQRSHGSAESAMVTDAHPVVIHKPLLLLGAFPSGSSLWGTAAVVELSANRAKAGELLNKGACHCQITTRRGESPGGLLGMAVWFLETGCLLMM